MHSPRSATKGTCQNYMIGNLCISKPKHTYVWILDWITEFRTLHPPLRKWRVLNASKSICCIFNGLIFFTMNLDFIWKNETLEKPEDSKNVWKLVIIGWKNVFSKKSTISNKIKIMKKKYKSLKLEHILLPALMMHHFLWCWRNELDSVIQLSTHTYLTFCSCVKFSRNNKVLWVILLKNWLKNFISPPTRSCSFDMFPNINFLYRFTIITTNGYNDRLKSILCPVLNISSESATIINFIIQ